MIKQDYLEVDSKLQKLEIKAKTFDEEKHYWRTCNESQSSTQISKLKIVSYNVLFNHHVHIRHPVLLELVKGLDPDLIAFQEVTPPFLNYLTQLPWVRENYYLSDSTGETITPYGVIILSKIKPCRFYIQNLPSTMARKLVVGEFLINNRKFQIGTVHLESYPMNIVARSRQVRLALHCMKYAEDSALMGDFNFEKESENEAFDKEYKDAWLELNDINKDPGFTFDFRQNSMCKDLHYYSIARYDRFIMKSNDDVWKTSSFEIIGNKPIIVPEQYKNDVKGVLFPSDHFGLFITLTSTTPFVTNVENRKRLFQSLFSRP